VPPVGFAQSIRSDLAENAIESREAELRREVLKDQVGICVSLSGGGMRAAAYHGGILAGIVEGLRAIDAQGHGIDLVSGISGGSITAALYALHPGEDWLKTGLPLLRSFIRGRPVAATVDGVFGERSFSDRLRVFRGILEKSLFGRKAFEDLKPRPHLIISATDFQSGKQIEFTRITLWHLQREVTMADVVSASSSIPGVLNPFTLRNPTIAGDFLGDAYQLEEKGAIPLHDGGISDNLGVKPLLTRAKTRTIAKRPDQILPLCHVLLASDASQRAIRVSADTLSSLVPTLIRSMDLVMEIVSSGIQTEGERVHGATVAFLGLRDGLREIPTTKDLTEEQMVQLIAAGRDGAYDMLAGNTRKGIEIKNKISELRKPAQAKGK
jgi:predicted acylesterase/phospholipase RssA